jgi:hypothetical protein
MKYHQIKYHQKEADETSAKVINQALPKVIQ